MEQKIVLIRHGETTDEPQYGGKILTQNGYIEIIETTQKLIRLRILSKNIKSTHLCSSLMPWCTASAYACSQELNEIDFHASFKLSDVNRIKNEFKFLEDKLIEYSTLIIITHIDVLAEIQLNLIDKIWGNKPFDRETIKTPVKVRVLLPDSKKLIIGDPD